MGAPPSSRVRPRYARIIGRADGSIIATIMTTMTAKNAAAYEPVDSIAVCGDMKDIVTSCVVQTTYHERATTSATSAATGIVTRGNAPASLCSAAPDIDPPEEGTRYLKAPRASSSTRTPKDISR